MLQHIRISAICFGVFIGYVTPLLNSALLFFGMETEVEKQNLGSARTLFGLLVVINIFGSIAGGYAAAFLARQQQLLHGLLTAIIGYAIISPFREFSFMMAIVFMVGGVVGAWLSK
jgi:hypothetical protein